MQRYFADHFVANEPSPRRAKSPTDSFDPKSLRQVVKGHGQVSKEARTHSRAKSGLWMSDLLPSRTWLSCWLAVELQFFPAADELDMSASFVKQSRQIQRGRSAANHYDVATLKRRDLAMACAVREKFLGQMRQAFGNIIEMGDADRQYHRPGMNRLTILELQHESAGHPTNICYQLIFE